MKYKYILPTLAAMGMLVASCSNDEFLSKVQGGSGQLVTVSASAAGGETRMAVTETASGDVKFTWESSDKLYVINPSNAEITPFALTEGAGKVRGNFSGTPSQAYTSGQNLMALFTHNDSAPATINQDRNGIFLDLSGQDGTLTDKYQYMFGQGIYQPDGNVEFALSNLVSVVKATVNNLPQNETFSKIIFSDNNSSYRSNAYLMLQDGKYGNDEYHAGDLVRKGVLYEFNGQWNERVQAEDDYESAITLNGSFSAAEGSLTKYFYVMETCNTDNHQNDGGSGVDRYEISSHCYMQPSVLLMGTQHVYSATANNPKYIGGGKIFDLQLYAQALPEFTLDTPMQVSARDENYKQLYYVFKAPSAGTYKVGGDTGYFFPLSDNANTHYGPNTSIEMVADQIVVLGFDGNSTVTIQPVVPLEVNKEYEVNQGDCYPFTPTETGLYKLDGLDHNFNIQLGEGPTAQWISSNPAVLTAGVTYKYNFYGNATFTFKKIETGTLTVGDTNACVSSQPEYDAPKTLYLFTPSESGLYKFTTPDGCRPGFLDQGPARTEQNISGNIETVMILEGGKTYCPYFYFYTYGSETGQDINVKIENLGNNYVELNPGIATNVSAGQIVVISATEFTLFKVEGTASLTELYGDKFFSLRNNSSAIYTCQDAGEITVSPVNDATLATYSLCDAISLQADVPVIMNVDYSMSGMSNFTTTDASASIKDYDQSGNKFTLSGSGTSPTNGGKHYLVSDKDVTITFSK